MTEPTYTLDEAREVLAREQCIHFGHDWQVVMAGPWDVPVKIFCGRCGMSAVVEVDPK